MKLAKTAVLAALAATGASAQTNLGAQTPQASLPFVMTQVATFNLPWRLAAGRRKGTAALVLQNLAYCYWPAIAPRLASPLLPVQLGSLCRAVVLGYDRRDRRRQRRLISVRRGERAVHRHSLHADRECSCMRGWCLQLPCVAGAYNVVVVRRGAVVRRPVVVRRRAVIVRCSAYPVYTYIHQC